LWEGKRECNCSSQIISSYIVIFFTKKCHIHSVQHCNYSALYLLFYCINLLY
jgi:hypothetical protein